MAAPAERRAPPEHRIAYPNVIVGAALDGEREYAADAVVVGTGAGGATAAARLRDAGLDVLMLEEGALHPTESFVTDPATMIRRLYRDAGTTMILGRPPIIFAEGRCVGGSTVINGGMSWRAPERVLARWERDLGLPDTGPRAMEPYFAQAERILHVEPNHEDTFGENTQLFLAGARRLGWPAARAPRNMRRCMGLNNCALGCPTGAKQGILIGYAAVPPGLLAAALPGVGEENAGWMRHYNHMLTAATLVEDEGEGRVVLGPDRQPYMLFDLSPRDLETVHRGVALTAELLFAAGARRVLLPFTDLPTLEGPDQLRRIHERPPVPDTVELMTVHIMGTARMATDARRGATDASGAVHGTDGLVVADASALPSSIGVNPQETIIALALRNAERWLEARGAARRRAAGG